MKKNAKNNFSDNNFAIKLLEEYTYHYAEKSVRDRYLELLRYPNGFHKWRQGFCWDENLFVARKTSLSNINSTEKEISKNIFDLGLSDTRSVFLTFDEIYDDCLGTIFECSHAQILAIFRLDDKLPGVIFLSEFYEFFFSKNLWRLFPKGFLENLQSVTTKPG